MYTNQPNQMRVIKRSGIYEDISFDKILNRIKSLSSGLNIDATVVAQKVVKEIYDGVKTSELDELSSQISISMYSKNIDYKTLASHIIISNHHKNTLNSFSEKIIDMYNYKHNGIGKPLIGDYLYDLVMENRDRIDSKIDYQKDYNYDFFGFKTLEKTYLFKINNEVI